MKWKTLQHNGILFPPAYEQKGFKVKIREDTVNLNSVQEEMAYQWAKKKDTPYVQDKVFQKNFTEDFLKALGPKYKDCSYSDIDFSEAYKLVDKEKDAREMISKEDKKKIALQRKQIRDELKAKYGKAVMDGKEVEVANYLAEPPGIFIGRGDHPLRGRWKPRVTEKEVTLNLGKDAKVPSGSWAKIVHEQDSMWLACWTDFLTGKIKYVWLADTAGLKQERDRAKYEKAVKLAKEIDKVKEKIVKDMTSKDPRLARIATACYLIFRTAMRVGDEKDPDEADTVGATTLRKEHVKIAPDGIEFDFLGKDSVRWQEKIPAVGQDKQFQDNLRKLLENKKPSDEIFDGITSRHVNAYYSSIVKGLTAKVFRTFLGTTVVKEYLKQHDNIKSKSDNEKMYHAKMANLEAAKMLNHKRTIPKNFDEALQKKKDAMKSLEHERPWEKIDESIRKMEQTALKNEKEKQSRAKKLKSLHDQLKKRRESHKDKIEKLKLQVELSERTRDYNLGTSLRNYVDPRVFKAWTAEVGAQWEKLYTAALQKKFLWVQNENPDWKKISQE